MEAGRALRFLYTIRSSKPTTLSRAQPAKFFSSPVPRPTRIQSCCRSLSGRPYDSSNSSQSRPYSISRALRAETQSPNQGREQPSSGSALSRLSQSIRRDSSPRTASGGPADAFNILEDSSASSTSLNYVSNEYHLYVFSHKHNTHLTLTEPQHEDPGKAGRRRQHILLSMSTGNLGFRKAQRGSYDAAYQLGAYVMSRIQNDGLLARIHRLELVFRGFGQGRDAVTKIILGMEGAIIRDRIVRVVDSSRIKMGGQRSPKPRRLG